MDETVLGKKRKRKMCSEMGCTSGAIHGYEKCRRHGGGRRCVHPGCSKSAVGATEFCKKHGGGRRCVHPGCSKSARDASEFCIEHGGGRRCVDPECSKSAQGATEFCKKHGGGRRCVHSECSKSAQGATEFCVEHGGGRRCVHPGCSKSAAGATEFCKKHGGGRRCVHPGCSKSAEGPTEFCVEHGGGCRCVHPGCSKSARGATEFCKEHGGGRRCVHPGCSKSAQGATEFCIEHGGGRRCPNCIEWIDSRSGSRQYDNYCARCFKRVFPDDPRSKRIYEHTQEIRVRNAITEKASEDDRFRGFVHDKTLYLNGCDCTHKRRVDHRKLIHDTILAVETDEYAHRSYDPVDEEQRYDDLFMVHSGKWIFIRFNPDPIRECRIDIDDRIEQLINEMERQIVRIEKGENRELVEIVKMFYHDGTSACLQNG